MTDQIVQEKNEEKLDAMVTEAAAQFGQDVGNIPENKSVDLSGLKETILNYIVPLVSIMLTLVVVLFVLIPSIKNTPQLQMELELKRKLKSDLSMKITNLKKLVDFSAVVDENSELVNKVLVSEQLVPGLLTQVDKIVQESGLNINRLNYGLGVTTETGESGDITYNFVTVNLGVNGTEQQLMVFLKNLENAARVINIDKFRYSLSESDAGEYLGINFVLVSPYLFVESNAVTDELVDLDIASPAFIDLINKLKSLKYYDPTDINLDIQVVETTDEDEELFEEELFDIESEAIPEEIITPAEEETVLRGGDN